MKSEAKKWIQKLGMGVLLGVAMSLPVHAQELHGWEKVKHDGVLKVALYNDLVPFSDKAKGIDADIATALADKLGLKVKFLPFPADETMSDDLRNMVWKGHYMGYGPGDVMMHVPIDPLLMKQEDKVLFFAPYVHEDVYVVRNKKDIPELNSFAPFAEHKVGAEMNSIGGLVLAGADHGKYIEMLHNYKTARMAMEGLLKGEVSAVMATKPEIESALFKQPNAGDFAISKVSYPALPPKGWVSGLAVKATNQQLAIELRKAMDELQQSGELQKIFAKYGVTYDHP